MSGRIWFYLAAFIIIGGLFSYRAAETNRVKREVATIELTGVQDQKEQVATYLKKQTDDRKVVSYAKSMKNADPEIVKIIADRAYELNPNSRDIALLASAFHPELKSRVTDLDPLYPEKK